MYTHGFQQLKKTGQWFLGIFLPFTLLLRNFVMDRSFLPGQIFYRLVLIASAPCRRSPSCPNFGPMSTSPDPRGEMEGLTIGRKCFYVPDFQHQLDLSTRRAQQIITAHMQLEDQGIGTLSNSSVPVLSKLERDLVSVRELKRVCKTLQDFVPLQM